VEYLQEALTLNQTMIDHFWDKENGSFFFTADDAEEMLVRPRELRGGVKQSAACENHRQFRP
jgi:uncharacterized protein YyaL (SSP411 family)